MQMFFEKFAEVLYVQFTILSLKFLTTPFASEVKSLPDGDVYSDYRVFYVFGIRVAVIEK